MSRRKWLNRLLLRFGPTGSFVMMAVLLFILFVYAMFQGGFVSWFLFFSFLPFALYSFLLLLYPLQDFKFVRKISRAHLQAGNRVEVRLTGNRRFPFPLLFLVIEDGLPEELHCQDHKQIFFVGVKRRIEFTYTIPSAGRGEHVFSNVRVRTGDLLGLAEKEAYVPCPDQLLVFPHIVEMNYLPLENRFEKGGSAATRQFQKDTSLVAGLRQYQPGDRLATIDWKATARTNEMMAKEFEIRQSNDLLVILDRFSSADFEAAVTFAASFIRAILKHGGQTGLFSAGKDRSLFAIRGGEPHLQRILHHLAIVKPDSPVTLPSILEREKSLYQHPATIIVITSILTRELVDRAAYANKGALIIFLIKREGSSLRAAEEIDLAYARQRGVPVKRVREEEMHAAFSEVKLA